MSTTLETSALETAVQPINQAAGEADYQILLERMANMLNEFASEFPARQNQAATDFEEYKRAAHVSFHLENNALRGFKEREKALRAKWEQPVVQAVLCAAEGEGAGLDREGPDWSDFAKVFREHAAVRDAASGFIEAAGDEDEVGHAFGFGMVCGMMYSAITGITLTPPALDTYKEDLEQFLSA